MDMHVSSLKVSQAAASIPKMPATEWTEFVADIGVRGIMDPVQLGADGVTIIDGRHRYEAAVELGLDTIPAVAADLRGLSEEDFAIKAAVLRRQLTPDQRAAQAARLSQDAIAASKAGRAAKGGRARADKAAGRESGAITTTAGASSDQAPVKKRVLEEAAARCGTTVSRVKKARALLKASPGLHTEVAEGKTKLSAALAQVKKSAKSTADAGNDHSSLTLELGNVIENGKYPARFIGLVRIPWLKEVHLIWQVTTPPHKNELIIQKFADEILSGERVSLLSKLYPVLIQIAGGAPEIGKPPIKIADFSGSPYELTVRKKGNGPTITDVVPLKATATASDAVDSNDRGQTKVGS